MLCAQYGKTSRLWRENGNGARAHGSLPSCPLLSVLPRQVVLE